MPKAPERNWVAAEVNVAIASRECSSKSLVLVAMNSARSVLLLCSARCSAASASILTKFSLNTSRALAIPPISLPGAALGTSISILPLASSFIAVVNLPIGRTVPNPIQVRVPKTRMSTPPDAINDPLVAKLIA